MSLLGFAWRLLAGVSALTDLLVGSDINAQVMVMVRVWVWVGFKG